MNIAVLVFEKLYLVKVNRQPPKARLKNLNNDKTSKKLFD